MLAPVSAQAPTRRLFPPEELGKLEGPDRDEWQQPERVMDALGIADGAHVADLGAGGGWFTVRLATRVGPNGIVYAEDVQQPMIDSIKVVRKGKVRRAKLYYLRGRRGKSARIVEKVEKQQDKQAAAAG